MAVFNDERFVADAVTSILGQTFTDFELIVVDDGSRDASAGIVASFHDPRIRLIRQENRGLAASLNRAIEEARGAYIARHDSDDLSHPDRLRQQLELLDVRPRVVLAGTNADVLDEEGELLATSSLPLEDAEMRVSLRTASNPFIHGSVMFRRDVAVAAGLYRPEFKQAQDRDLWLRIAERGELANLPSPLYRWRMRRSNTSTSKFEDQRDYSRLARVCAERRAEGLPEPPLVIATVQRRAIRGLLSGLRAASPESMYDLNLAKMLLANGQRARARRHAFAVMRRHPANAYAWLLAALSLLPARGAGAVWNRTRAIYRKLIWRR
jgi:glycosyltransferase involved in cell wall biosynthesis